MWPDYKLVSHITAMAERSIMEFEELNKPDERFSKESLLKQILWDAQVDDEEFEDTFQAILNLFGRGEDSGQLEKPGYNQNFEHVLKLWDSYSREMERIYDSLIEGKSEFATIQMQSMWQRHNGQSRDFFVKQLKAKK